MEEPSKMAVVKTWSCVVALTIGGLATKTTTSTRTSHIWIFDDEKQYFCTLWTCIFDFKHFADVLVLFTTWNDLYYSWVDIVSIWWQMFNFVLLSLRRWFQFNSRIVRTHFCKRNDFELSRNGCTNAKLYFQSDVLAFRRLRLYPSSLVLHRR